MPGIANLIIKTNVNMKHLEVKSVLSRVLLGLDFAVLLTVVLLTPS